MEHASVVVRMDLLEIYVMIVSQFIPLIKNIEVILMKYVAYQYIYMYAEIQSPVHVSDESFPGCVDVQ